MEQTAAAPRKFYYRPLPEDVRLELLRKTQYIYYYLGGHRTGKLYFNRGDGEIEKDRKKELDTYGRFYWDRGMYYRAGKWHCFLDPDHDMRLNYLRRPDQKLRMAFIHEKYAFASENNEGMFDLS